MPRTSTDRRNEIAAQLRIAIVRTSRRLRQESRPGLSASLTSALATVQRHGPLTPSELAQRERLPRPAVTRIVAKLERDGLISRAADPLDRRSYTVAATGRGDALLARARKRSRAYLSRALRTLDEDALATLEEAAALLERLFQEEP